MKRSLGKSLLAAGAVICILGALGLTLGMFVTIPEAVADAILRIAGFSAPFLVGGVLMGAGAAVLRASRAAPSVDAARSRQELPPPVAAPPAPPARESAPAARRTTESRDA